LAVCPERAMRKRDRSVAPMTVTTERSARLGLCSRSDDWGIPLPDRNEQPDRVVSGPVGSERVGADDLSPLGRAQRTVDRREVDGVLQELDTPVTEHRVDPAGVTAPRGVGRTLAGAVRPEARRVLPRDGGIERGAPTRGLQDVG